MKEHDAIVGEKGVLFGQLMKRNDELSLLYDKIRIQTSSLHQGEVRASVPGRGPPSRPNVHSLASQALDDHDCARTHTHTRPAEETRADIGSSRNYLTCIVLPTPRALTPGPHARTPASLASGRNPRAIHARAPRFSVHGAPQETHSSHSSTSRVHKTKQCEIVLLRRVVSGQVRYQQLINTIADLEGQIKSMERDLVQSASQVMGQ